MKQISIIANIRERKVFQLINNTCYKNFKHIENAELRIFCFPHAGGDATVFKNWVPYFHDRIELYSIQLPGRGERINDPYPESLQLIIKQLAVNIIPLIKKDYIFLGHSFGAILAFELIKILRKSKLNLPKHLFVVGQEGPNIPKLSPIYNKSEVDIVKYLKQQSGTDSQLLNNTEALKHSLPTLINDLKISDKYFDYYKKENPLEIPITVFWGTNEPELNKEMILDWQNITSGKFRMVQFEGNHFFLHHNINSVVDEIINSLDSSA